jgi:hypothetical protein
MSIDAVPAENTFSTEFTNEGTIQKSDGDGNWYLWILAKDIAGNTTITRSESFNLDNTAPVATNIQYTPPTLTNGSVTLQITLNEPVSQPSERSGSAPGTVFTRVYTNNI